MLANKMTEDMNPNLFRLAANVSSHIHRLYVWSFNCGAARMSELFIFFLSLTDPLKSLLQIANESYLLVRQDTPRFIEHRPDTGSGSETS